MGSQKHSVEVIKPALQIDEQLKLHERGWVVQRIGWVLMVTIMVVAALGLFGEGLLSKKTVSAGNVNIEYERFFRYETEMKILLQSNSGHIANFSLPQQYLKKFRLVRVIPEPLNNSSTSEDVIFHFPPGDNRIVSVYVVPKDYGNIDGHVRINGSNTIPLKHFIYP